MPRNEEGMFVQDPAWSLRKVGVEEWHLYVAFEMGGIDTVSHFFSG